MSESNFDLTPTMPQVWYLDRAYEWHFLAPNFKFSSQLIFAFTSALSEINLNFSILSLNNSYSLNVKRGDTEFQLLYSFRVNLIFLIGLLIIGSPNKL